MLKSLIVNLYYCSYHSGKTRHICHPRNCIMPRGEERGVGWLPWCCIITHDKYVTYIAGSLSVPVVVKSCFLPNENGETIDKVVFYKNIQYFSSVQFNLCRQLGLFMLVLYLSGLNMMAAIYI